MFRIEDELHAEPIGGEYETLESAVAELRRLAEIPWDREPNRCPCTNWRNCGRRYEIIEYSAADPVPVIRRFRALEISAAIVKWVSMRPPLRGYMLFPASPVPGYRGVDRNPFIPALIDGEMHDSETTAPLEHIWQFYPPGWRRDAYKLYEENLADVSPADDGILLSSVEVALEIRNFIRPHAGDHEILGCDIRQIEDEGDDRMFPGAEFVGYDAAYSCGVYSAVLNGLFVNPDAELILMYKSAVNRHGLFPDASIATQYIAAFKQAVLSEANADFYVWALSAFR
jgi:hypothetical protein